MNCKLDASQYVREGYRQDNISPPNYSTAYVRYTRALKVQPSDSDAHCQMTWNMYKREKYKAAEVKSRYIIMRLPKFGPVYLTRGIILDALEKFDESVGMYKQSLQYEKDEEKKEVVYSYLTMALIKLGQYEEACEYSKKLVERQNANDQDNNIAGWLYFLRGEFDRARTYYDKAISLEPEDGLILMNQAIIFFLLGENEETQGILERIKSLGTKNQTDFKEEMKIYSDELKRLQKEGINEEENKKKNRETCIEGIKFIMNFIQTEL